MVGHTPQQRDRDQLHPHPEIDDRLIGEIDHEIGREPVHGMSHGVLRAVTVDEGDTGVEAAVERELLAPAEQRGANDDATRDSGGDVLDGGTHDGGVVLAVHENERPQGLAGPRERDGTPSV